MAERGLSARTQPCTQETLTATVFDVARNPSITCHAAEEAHPVLSPNKLDIRCQISGRLQPASDSPCCNDYEKCGIWRTAKRQEALGKTRVIHDLRRKNPSRDVLSGDLERDRIRV